MLLPIAEINPPKPFTFVIANSVDLHRGQLEPSWLSTNCCSLDLQHQWCSNGDLLTNTALHISPVSWFIMESGNGLDVMDAIKMMSFCFDFLIPLVNSFLCLLSALHVNSSSP